MKIGNRVFRWSCFVAAVAVVGGYTLDARPPERMDVKPDHWIEMQVDPAYQTGATPLPVKIKGEFVEGVLDGPPAGDPNTMKPGHVSVLVHMEPTLTKSAVERVSVRNLAAKSGGRVQFEYTTVMPNVLNLRDIPEGKLASLKKLPGVVKVELDQYHPNLVRLHDSIPLIRGLQSQLNGAGYTANGSGVRICIVDTGLDSDHMMFSSRIDFAASYDFYNNDSNAEDDHGHGSHCGGIAAGGTGITYDPCGTGPMPFQGVAPSATLIGAKVLNSGGGGLDSGIIAGIDHCADQSPSGGRADVISMSIGTGNYSGTCTHSWAVAANNAVANGVFAVAASGNENNSNSMGSPACGVDVMAVGMTWKNDYPTCEDNTTNWNWGICTDNAPQTDDVGCFSNESDLLDVTAPGANIWSASISAGGGSITGSSGTSMSCPTVAGLAALVLDVDPTLTPAEVRQIIRDGAIDLGPAGFDRAYGYGRIDVINTLALLTPCSVDADCDDGAWCNGSETCNAGSCVAGTDPCTGGDVCNELTDTCEAGPTAIYTWDMNSNPGWTTQGQWAWGQPTGGGGQYGGPDPTSGATGNNVYGYNLSGDYANNLSETHLTTTAIDCTGLSSVSLKFQRWLGVEVSTYDHAYVRVSNNGSSWTTLWSNGAQVADTAWSQQEFDISSVADGQSTVYLRWTMGTTDGSWQFCGWNIDDVEIWALGGGGGCTVDADCDDSVFCNGAETCNGGTCQNGTAPSCNDGVGCTDDSCNAGSDSCQNVVNDGNCDDGLACNGAETCHASLDCQSGTAVDCNDGVGCTTDTCNEPSGSCSNTPNDAACDDGTFCNGAETCDVNNDCQAGTAPTCDDGVGCTDDSCDGGTDSCDNVANDGNCDDGQACNGSETCHATNDCQSGTAVNCDDGVGCTTDSCNEPSGTCSNTPDNAACDDGLACNGSETCNATLDCQSGTAVDCNDGVGCTTDTCNEPGGTCSNAPSDAACDDGAWCNGSETCNATLDCQGGTAVNCDDGVGCTDDSCNETTDSCDNLANDANCDNGQFCDGAETCNATLDCEAGGDPCPGQSCNETTDTCVSCLVDGDCDDGLACNGAETCVGGSCQAGTAVDCDDGIACTTDVCNEPSGTCSNTPDDGACDDGLACNGAETCSATLDCQSGTAVDCDDGVGCTIDACSEPSGTCSNTPDDGACDDGAYCNGAETCDGALDCLTGTAVDCGDGVGCTDDSCNEVTDSCDNLANDANCDNGLFCDGAETCNATLDCQGGSDPCPGQSCDEGTDTCVSCLVDGDCDDGLACNGAETCVGGNCQAGTAVNCDDGVACTTDACNEPSGTCSNTPDDGACDDGLACNGAEWCDAVLDCQAGTAVDCDDGVGCTADSCNEPSGSCTNAPSDAACDDGAWCNGAETCSATLDCQAGTAVNCDDGVGCTDDSCNEATDSCDNLANDANCPDDLLFCTGTEYCDAALDCSATGDPCGAGTTCNETTDVCDATGPPPGEGYILSKNADFSTNDLVFYRTETIYMMLWTDQVDFNDLKKSEWELRDNPGSKVKQNLTNHFDGTYTAQYALSNLPSAEIDWEWRGKVEDNPGTRYRPSVFIQVLDAPACSIDADCDDADACTTDVCSAGTCSNTQINCDDGDACTADSCSGGVCVNSPLPTCCGDTFCDPGEDVCNCPADCGAPPGSEANCTDGIDDDCDGATDCVDVDCNGDPACAGPPPGEGFILSRNPDFSTDDRSFTRGETLYMKMWSDQVDFNSLVRERWELKDGPGDRIREPLTNHFDGTYTASFALSGLPSGEIDWTWKGEVRDAADVRYRPSVSITVSP